MGKSCMCVCVLYLYRATTKYNGVLEHSPWEKRVHWPWSWNYKSLMNF